MNHRAQIIVTLVVSLSLTGCFAGHGVRATRQPYNEAVQYTAKQQMLLNLVRTKYREPLQFIGIPNITEGLTYGSSGSWAFNPRSLTGWGFGASASESPTLSYQVLESDEFHRRMMAPISKDVVDLMKYSASSSQVIRTVVKNINDVDNASGAGGPTPERAPEFLEFKIGVAALQELFDLRQAEFAAVSSKDAEDAEEIKAEEIKKVNLGKTTKSDTSDSKSDPASSAISPPSTSGVFGSAQSPFRLDITYQQSDKLIPEELEASIVRVAHEAIGSPELQTVQQVFRLVKLTEEDPFYEFRLGDYGQLRRRGKLQAHMWVQTRSFMEVIHFLSQGTCIPQEHYDKGLVTCTRNYDGSIFDWKEVTGDLLQICVSECKPQDAATAVRYNGYWYYIRDNDLTSKSTFNLLIELYNVAVRGGAVGNAPALTIGV